MSDEAMVVLTTCEDDERARELADALIGGRVAACVNILPGIESVYRWNGNIERGREVLVVIKTTRRRMPEIETEIRARSTYELPELLAVPVASGSADYLDWIVASVRS